MTHYETKCQLCGVSLAIARIRHALEPPSAAWSHTGRGFVCKSRHDPNYDSGSDHQQGTGTTSCGPESGCTLQLRDPLRPRQDDAYEHVAGAECVCAAGYSGLQVGVEEMAGCRAVRCLVRKPRGAEGWMAEKDDEDFEVAGDYFLTGFADGSPGAEPLVGITPARHGVGAVVARNWIRQADDDSAIPFHPTCFEIFKTVSKKRLGRVDMHGLWSWRRLECSDPHAWAGFHERFPRDFAVRNGHSGQQWRHERGSEWLAANPIAIPGLSALIKRCRITFDEVLGVFGWDYTSTGGRFGAAPLPASGRDNPTDHFLPLPNELAHMIISYCGSKDIANLRLVTRVSRQLPVDLFRRLLAEDMPWLWEMEDLNDGSTSWWKLYRMVKFCWANDVKGLRNRRRIWKDGEELLNRIERLKREGFIIDED